NQVDGSVLARVCREEVNSSPSQEAPLAIRPPQEPRRPTIYQEAMEVFHRAADLIGLDRRVRMELEEPDYEHIFYVTVKLHTRLAPLTAGADRFKDLADSELLPDGLEPLLDGSFVFKRRAL